MPRSRFPAPSLGERAARLGGAARDHVDHAVHRIGAPQRGAGTADHLDAIDVVEQRVLRIPEHAGEERRVDRAAVDQHQELVADRVVEAACADRVLPRIDPRHLEVRREAQRFGKTGHAGAADVLAGDHVERRGGVGEPLGAARYRRDLQIGQLLEAELGEIGSKLHLRSRAG